MTLHYYVLYSLRPIFIGLSQLEFDYMKGVSLPLKQTYTTHIQ